MSLPCYHADAFASAAFQLGKPDLLARQVSARGGELFCESTGDRVRIGGKAELSLRGEIQIPA